MADVTEGDVRPGWLRRFWAHLGTRAGKLDGLVKLIVAERLIKSAALIAFGISVLAFGRHGRVAELAAYIEDQLNLSAGRGLLSRLLTAALNYVGHYPHIVALAVAALLYAALEGTEGIGLLLRRRWAEYLTVLATAALIPFEVSEVIHKVSLLRVGALLVNVAIVVYLAYRKRLFVGI